ncbi:AAA family ATPase [Pseudomonas aeruginosa]|uniref:UvrD-helicase domain-containing protein n=1 Tax=Pseudomonas aeruginosa TaxID=287 RepID=UPI00071B60A9|nr:UvrD-helicase domain-containing protein [Pseudomonas aeruginosa]KSH32315.1 AAA family ATPase [Pseudomonas aeruginosa]MCD2748820.1 UvrD-helicase domain-containing protein [Pseudomonas aeruginosa]MCO3303541.1 ATP-dependent helicase [Pseudomonas aeruginosa]MDF5802469.1 UvrD-helicase domain-containing protein [Pseudomonas aeruginosa]MDF5806583.1 UvrD-helicase domain-containing protein [Pseudomonas aeruginosa]
MSRRIDSPDTDADREIHACIVATPPQPFVVRAGAGSGKTTSLIKALDWVISEHGASMRARKQKVACITYTDLATNEILADVNDDPLVHVSTIHSFYWSIATTFQADIKVWLQNDIRRRISELEEEFENYSSRVRQTTRDRNKADQERYARSLEAVASVRTFNYGVGSDYAKGILGHEDILQLADFLLQNRPLFRRVVALSYPFVFIDESQDTFPGVVKSFKEVEAQMQGKFCLGFFGDPMQSIFMRGAGDIQLEDHWRAITKPENFRCAKQILDVANAVRAQGDGMEQVRGLHEKVDGNLKLVEGSARMFVLPNTLNRTEALARVRAWSSATNNDEGWTTPDIAVKILVIVHRMAANRLGFGGIYSALNDKTSDAMKQGMQDGTGWPVRPFLSFVLPIIAAVKAGNEFAAMSLLREFSPRLAPAALTGRRAADVLRELHAAVSRLVAMLDEAGTTIGDIALHLSNTGLFEFDERYARVLGFVRDIADTIQEPEAADAVPAEGLSSDAAMAKFFHCSAQELWPYERYVSEGSPYATQHGVKGAQFERVMVVMDEEESDYRTYNYERVFASAEARAADRARALDGDENTWSRTLRLLYVCCTRAQRGLVLAFFVADPATTLENVVASGILPRSAVFTQDVLVG